MKNSVFLGKIGLGWGMFKVFATPSARSTILSSAVFVSSAVIAAVCAPDATADFIKLVIDRTFDIVERLLLGADDAGAAAE